MDGWGGPMDGCFFFYHPPSSGIAPCVRTTWKWYRRHTLAKPCLAALGLVLILGRTSGSEDGASPVREILNSLK